MTGLRERKRKRTMQQIQLAAMDLFDQKGFEQVTLEEIAASAEVSVMTVYRYFGSKENLIILDEYEGELIQRMTRLLAEGYKPWTAVRQIIDQFQRDIDVPYLQMAQKRMRHYLEVPALTDAAYGRTRLVAEELAKQSVALGQLESLEARVIWTALWQALNLAVEEWYKSEDPGSFQEKAYKSLDALRGLGD